jgi:hypothetical protein
MKAILARRRRFVRPLGEIQRAGWWLPARREAGHEIFPLSYVVSAYTTHSLEGRTAGPGRLPVGGTLVLHRGAADLTLPSGMKCTASAPSRITLGGPNRLEIADGLARFHVPESAKGFRVRTPDLEVIDHGTEFMIDSTRRGHNEAHVLRGRIEVRALDRRGGISTLTNGRAWEIDEVVIAAGILLPQQIEALHHGSILVAGLALGPARQAAD